MKTVYDLVAQVGKNFGVSNTLQNNRLYYNIDTISYTTKEKIDTIDNEGTMLILDVENSASPAVLLVETLDGCISDDDQDKVYNIAGYCKYHNIEFTVLEYSEYVENFQ